MTDTDIISSRGVLCVGAPAREATSARELRVRVADEDGLGPELSVARDVAFPSIALVAPGLYGVAYAAPSSVETVFVRCATIAIPTL